ncbi:transposase [Streptomyces sp. NPDC091649]|uniref:transposase n=1 Tax=Streptomyces sp. NPDC091649 TaxID=3366004 RepID=UPI003813E9C3
MLVGRDRCDDSAVRGGVSTRPWIVDDDLCALVEPLLPPWPERSPGPRSVWDRLCLQGILFVLYNDIAWQLPPLGLGFGSGQACWRASVPAQKSYACRAPARFKSPGTHDRGRCRLCRENGRVWCHYQAGLEATGQGRRCSAL